MKQFAIQLASLIPVLVGALIALMGGVIKYWIDRRDAKGQRRREKLERLLHLVYSLKPWTDSLDSRHAFGLSDKELDSPIEEIEVLGNLFFHELLTEIDAVVIAAKHYQAAMLLVGAARLRTGRQQDDAQAKIGEFHQPLLVAIKAFTVKARDLAKKLD